MIEFFFDCSSPWTYLAWHNIQPMAKELGVEIIQHCRVIGIDLLDLEWDPV